MSMITHKIEFNFDDMSIKDKGNNDKLVTIPAIIDGESYKITVGFNEVQFREQHHLKEKDSLVEKVKKIVKDLSADKIIAQSLQKGEKKIGGSISLKKVERPSAKEMKTHVAMKAFEVQKKEKSQGSTIGSPRLRYLSKIQNEILQIENSYKGLNLHARNSGAEKFTALRKELAFEVFQSIRPEIERLMMKYGDKRSFDEVVCIFGFNRLFTRDRASAGTDIDFMLLIDTNNQDLVNAIREKIKNSIAPKLRELGVDMETADYLIIDLSSYLKKLDSTRSALFTIANIFNPLKSKENVAFIAGSESMLREKVFSLSNEQLAEHYAQLLQRSGKLPERAEVFKEKLVAKLKEEGGDFKSKVVDALQKMACSELYIGKNPYNKKKTIQTEMASAKVRTGRKERNAPFSIKFCLNRIADLFQSTTLDVTRSDPKMTNEQLQDLEAFGMMLCNYVVYTEAGAKAPIHLTEAYSDITLEQIKKMPLSDRVIMAYFMKNLDIEIDPFSDAFPEQFYDGLWSLADRLLKMAQNVEESIFNEALII